MGRGAGRVRKTTVLTTLPTSFRIPTVEDMLTIYGPSSCPKQATAFERRSASTADRHFTVRIGGHHSVCFGGPGVLARSGASSFSLVNFTSPISSSPVVVPGINARLSGNGKVHSSDRAITRLGRHHASHAVSEGGVGVTPDQTTHWCPESSSPRRRWKHPRGTASSETTPLTGPEGIRT